MTSVSDNLHISNNGLDIIKAAESFSPTWYLCPAKKWTIGWGHVRTAKDKFSTVSKTQAELILRSDCLIAESCIKQNVRAALNQNQFDALTSFIFNIGIGAFTNSTMLKLLNEGKYQLASEQFKRWINPPSARNGLMKRRLLEKKLFLGGSE